MCSRLYSKEVAEEEFSPGNWPRGRDPNHYSIRDLGSEPGFGV